MWQWLLIKQHNAHTSKEKVNLNCKVWFLLPYNNKFYHQINGGNQSTINRMTKIQNESFQSPYIW
jgi:hypothetical protein